jgi:hypothetical protein
MALSLGMTLENGGTFADSVNKVNWYRKLGSGCFLRTFRLIGSEQRDWAPPM